MQNDVSRMDRNRGFEVKELWGVPYMVHGPPASNLCFEIQLKAGRILSVRWASIISHRELCLTPPRSKFGIQWIRRQILSVRVAARGEAPIEDQLAMVK